MNHVFSNSAAFDPFYCDVVAVEGRRADRKIRGSYPACIFDNGYSDPVAEGDTSSERRSITVQIPRTEDGWLTGGPKIGDTVALQCGARFKVKSVASLMGGDWLMEARGL